MGSDTISNKLILWNHFRATYVRSRIWVGYSLLQTEEFQHHLLIQYLPSDCKTTTIFSKNYNYLYTILKFTKYIHMHKIMYLPKITYVESDKAKARTKSYEWHLLFPPFLVLTWWKNMELSTVNQYKSGVLYGTSVLDSFTSIQTSTLNFEKNFRKRQKSVTAFF